MKPRLAGFALLIVSCSAPASDRVTRAPSPSEAERRFATGTAPGVVVAADIDGDGRTDLVVANEQSADATVLLGDGKGDFSPAAGSPFPAGNSPNDIAVGDFNGDGRADLAFANHEVQQLSILLNDGHGRLVRGTPVNVTVRPHPHGIATADFNGDGHLDLATDSWASDELEILAGDGKGRFHPPGSYVRVGKHPYQRIRAADLNGDGRMDIVSPNLDGNDVTILLGTAEGGFREAMGSPFKCGDSPFNVAIGDINADGKLDLAIVNCPRCAAGPSGRDGLTMLAGDGRGGFAAIPGSPFDTGGTPNIAAIGDINGDGVNDVAVSSPESNHITLFMMRHEAAPHVVTRPAPGHPKGLVISDVDGDGRGEIAVTNNQQNTVTIMNLR